MLDKFKVKLSRLMLEDGMSQQDDFIKDYVDILDRVLVKRIINAFGGWEVFKREAIAINNSDSPECDVYKRLSDDHSLSLFNKDSCTLYRFAQDYLFVDTSDIVELDFDEDTSLSMRDLEKTFKYGVNKPPGYTDKPITSVMVAMLVMHTVDKERTLNIGMMIRFFNLNKESYSRKAKSLLRIDPNGRGHYKPIIDEGVRITLHDLLNACDAGGNYINEVSHDTKVQIAKLLVHIAVQALCRKVTLYNLVN